MNIEGWTIVNSKDGYIRAVRRIKGKLICVYVGKTVTSNTPAILRRHEQVNRIKLSDYQAYQKNSCWQRKMAPKRANNKLSVPAQYLLDYGYLSKGGTILDYGCGYGTDADILIADKYDPYFYPNIPPIKYDIILCLHVAQLVHSTKKLRDYIRKHSNSSAVVYYAFYDSRKKRKTSYGAIHRQVVFKRPIPELIKRIDHTLIYREII